MNVFEITIQRKTDKHWPVSVRHQAGAGSLTRWSQGILALKLDELENFFPTDKAYGELLGKAIFQERISQAFTSAMAEAKTEDESLRVLLFIEADDLKMLRWEQTCAPFDRGWDYLLLNQDTPFSLYLPSQIERRFPPIGSRDLRALILVAGVEDLGGNYKLSTFDMAETIRGVKESLGEIPSDVLASVEGSLAAPTLGNLISQLTDTPYTILHIVCHGAYNKENGESILFLPDTEQERRPVTATTLIEQLGRLKRLPHFAFLSTCESALPKAETGLGGMAQRLVRDLGMPAVLAMTDKISIPTAGALASVFYRRLSAHGEVDRALAGSLTKMQGRFDVTVPALFSRLGGRPLFSDRLDRPLNENDFKFGLEQMAALVKERAPILEDRFQKVSKELLDTLGADSQSLSADLRSQRERAQEEIYAMCMQIADIEFEALIQKKKPPVYNPRCPFVGLNSFQPEDQDFFFGRDALIEQLEKRLAEHNFLAVLGPSGSGKSSVVLAGLIPRMKGARIAKMTPGNQPMASLDEVLSGYDQVIVIDQFEELFTLCPNRDERTEFINKILSLSKTQKVIITMRADFWGEVAHYRALKDEMVLHQELVSPMDSNELRVAAEMQAATVGLRFEANVSQQILNDVEGEPGAMPLLQHALRELWARRHGRWMLAEEYHQIGGVQKSIAGTANTLFYSLSPEDQTRLKNIFLNLTHVNNSVVIEGEARDTRQRVESRLLIPENGDPAPIMSLINRLVNARLVNTSVNKISGQQEVEVAHEALIRHWPELKGWIDENRVGLFLRNSVRMAAKDWLEHNKNKDQLTYRGNRLDEALRILQPPMFALSADEKAFLAACKAQVESEKRREMLISRGIAGVSVFVAVAAAVAAIIFSNLKYKADLATQAAVESQRETETQKELAVQSEQKAKDEQQKAVAEKQKATAGEQASQVLANLNNDPDQYSLLGLEAYNQFQKIPGQSDNYLGRGALLTALQGSNGISQRLYGHINEVNAVSFNLDGSRMVSAGDDGRLILWDTSNKEQAKPVAINYEKDRPAIIVTKFSRDGSLVASGSADGKVMLWRGASLELDKDLSVPDCYYVNSIAFSPGGNYLAAICDEYWINLWDVTDGRSILQITYPDPSDPSYLSYLYSLEFSQDGSTLFASTDKGTIVSWILSAPNEPSVFKGQHGAFALTLAANRDHTLLASASPGDDTIIIWDVASQTQLGKTIENKSGPQSLAFSPDGNWLYSGNRDGTVSLWYVQTQQLIVQPFTGHAGRIWDIATDPDGRFATAGRDKTIAIWNIFGDYPTIGMSLTGHQSNVLTVSFTSGDEFSFSVGADGTLNLFNMKDRVPLDPISTGFKTAYSAAYSSKANSLALAGCSTFEQDGSTCAESKISFWKITAQSQEVTSLTTGKAQISHLAFNADGTRVATINEAGQVQVWDPKSPQPTELSTPGKANERKPSATAVKFGPENLLAVGYDNGDLALWDIASKEKIADLQNGHTKDVLGLAFNPTDSRILVSSGRDGSIITWDILTKKRLGTPVNGRASSISDIAFSTNGKTLVSANNDQTITLWDVDPDTHQLRLIGQPLSGHFSQVLNVAFSSNGDFVISGGKGGSVLLWNMNPQIWIEKLCQKIGRNFTTEEWSSYFSGTGYNLTCAQWPKGIADIMTLIPVTGGSSATTTAPETSPAPVENQPQPTTTPETSGASIDDLLAQIHSAKILLFEDTSAEGIWIKPVLENDGFTVDFIGDRQGTLKTKLTSGEPWDLIIIAAESHVAVSGEFWGYIRDYLDNGAAAIVETWSIDTQVNGAIKPVLQTCGIEWQRDLNKAVPIYWLLPDDAFLNIPNSGLSLEKTTRFWPNQAGDLMRKLPGSDAVILAGIDATTPDSNGVITSCYGGRLILQTFSNHDYPKDQIGALWLNYVYNALKNRFAP